MLLLVAWIVGIPAAAGAPGTSPRRIRFVVHGLRSDQGLVRCALYADPDSFPGDISRAVETTRGRVRHGIAECDFAGPRAGYYAVAAYHDENENGRFDRTWLGLPREGHAISNDQRTYLRIPSFDPARFPYFGGVLRLDAHMMY